MEKLEVREILIGLIKENTVVTFSSKAVKDDTDLITELGFDSLTIVQLVSDIESKFNIDFDVEELVSEVIEKFGTLLDKVMEKITEEHM